MFKYIKIFMFQNQDVELFLLPTKDHYCLILTKHGRFLYGRSDDNCFLNLKVAAY